MARIWDWRTGRLVCPALEHEDEVFDAKFLADGWRVMTTDRDATARLWESTTGKLIGPVRSLSSSSPFQLLLVPDGSHGIVAGRARYIDILNLSSLTRSYGNRLDLPSLRLLGEVLSGRRIEEGGSVNLTSQEWFQRWQLFRDKWPGYRHFGQANADPEEARPDGSLTTQPQSGQP
jgi:WD40 repeat protein